MFFVGLVITVTTRKRKSNYSPETVLASLSKGAVGACRCKKRNVALLISMGWDVGVFTVGGLNIYTEEDWWVIPHLLTEEQVEEIKEIE